MAGVPGVRSRRLWTGHVVGNVGMSRGASIWNSGRRFTALEGLQVNSHGLQPLVRSNNCVQIMKTKPPPRSGAEGRGVCFSTGYVTMPQSFACLHYHLIFSTKDRVPLLVRDFPERVYAYMGGILRSEKGSLVAAGGMPDHVHLLVSLGRESSVSDVLRQIKGSSSRWINETCPELRGFAWQVGYAAFAVSYSHLPKVREYIATQAEHHRTATFKEEFLTFLRKHDLAFDEQYLWD